MNENDLWRFEHSVECQASRDFAWQFWTNVENWAVVDRAVEWVRLDGPFVSGAKGATKPRGSDQVDWEIVEVKSGRSATIEIAAPGAVMKFIWIFEDSPLSGTSITQQLVFDGERNDDYAEVLSTMERTVPSGMNKLAEAIDKAAGKR